MAYVITRDSDHAYVARSGFPSYTRRLEEARIYPTREIAEQDLCIENETVRDVASLLSA